VWPLLRLTRPAADARYVHKDLTLSGVALSPTEAVEVSVTISGSTHVASSGLPSPELAAEYPSVPGADRAGFEASIDVSGWTRGARTITVTAVDEDGRTAVQEREVYIEPYLAPVGDTQALEGRGATLRCGQPPEGAEVPMPVRVEGRAYARQGVERVLVFIDGRARFEAVYGLTRPEVLRISDSEDALSSGFALTLDPLECLPGSHELTVVALLTDGSCVGLQRSFVCRRVSEGGGRHVTRGRFVPGIATGTETEAAHRARYRWALSLAAGLDVLDAGCGVGYGTEVLVDGGASSAVGVDISDHAIAAARSRAGAALRFEVGDVERLPMPDGSFDLVTCFEVIEYVQHPERALDELRRVLRPGGVLLISSPNRGAYPPGNRWHVHEYTSGELEQSLRRRFPQVRMYRQHAHIASVIASDETSAAVGEELEVKIQLRKLVGVEPGGELYTLAAASDSSLPELPELALLGGADQVIQGGALAHAWRERALVAEAELAAVRARKNSG
jgi:ubiquinone/menaquinone biosynthesis C-methylase UbiE